ncbi:putative gamma-glutamyltransferase YwrD [Phycisphaerae bacterium RAS1]|nr:putative gamma-glutamyltransferase YwrD [Phycisphaerae bacterium RAS1]
MSGASTAILLLIVGVLSVVPARGGDRVTGRFFATRSEVIARHGMACTSHPLATQAALDILKAGGSAADAAIAANACLGLMEPVSCGIGGDLFAIVWDARTGKLSGLNASGRSPYGLSRQHFIDKGLKYIPDFGPLPISVPGCVDGWFELHGRFGKLPMKDVLAPAIRYAREGFPVTELIAYYWAAGARLSEHPGFAATFLPGGQAPAKGEIFKNPMLAETLEKLAAGGRDAFYKGELAERMDAFFQRDEVGCFLRKRDFEEHTSAWVEPVSVNYRGYDVWELPPPGQGIAALQMLNILEGIDLRTMGHNSAAYLHTLVEAKKLVYEDRARYYCDPDFVRTPVAWLLSKEYAAERRKLIDPKRAARVYPAGKLADADTKLRENDTTYLTVADGEGNMISLIQSNYRGFGSGLCPDGLGFCLQDRGALFTLEEGHPNCYEPHKRPFHTIIPGFVTRGGKPWLSFGVMGGDMQPQGHVQVLCNLIDFGMSVQEAGDAARFYHTGSSEPTGQKMSDGGTLSLESGVDPQVMRDLSKMGHRLRDALGAYGGYQAILWDEKNGVYVGASESRKDGQAGGY